MQNLPVCSESNRSVSRRFLRNSPRNGTICPSEKDLDCNGNLYWLIATPGSSDSRIVQAEHDLHGSSFGYDRSGRGRGKTIKVSHFSCNGFAEESNKKMKKINREKNQLKNFHSKKNYRNSHRKIIFHKKVTKKKSNTFPHFF